MTKRCAELETIELRSHQPHSRKSSHAVEKVTQKGITNYEWINGDKMAPRMSSPHPDVSLSYRRKKKGVSVLASEKKCAFMCTLT